MSEEWERRLRESAKAYAAFVVYRDLGAERSTAAVARSLGRSKTLIDRWSSRHGWVARARARDDEIDRQTTAAKLREAVEMEDRHGRAAVALQARALQALKDIQGDKVSPRDLTYMMDIAVKIERLSRGQPSERVELVGQLVTPLIQALIAVFVECNDIDDREARAATFAERADEVTQAVVGRFLPTGIGGTA